MKISFIIPVYNCKPYLPACVDSIRAVGVADYEILLIDDGSTDGSGAVCDELAAKYPRIRVVHQENAGVSSARNRGIQESVGDRLMLIDADDTLDSDAMRKVLTDPKCQENDLIILGMSFDFYRKGNCYRSDPVFFEFDGTLDRNQWSASFMQMFQGNAMSSVCNKIFRRDALTGQGILLDTSMFIYEDLEFVLRYLRHCENIWNVPQAIYHYRQNESESNAKQRLKRIGSIAEYLKPIERALAKLPSAVCEQDRSAILQLLYMFLAQDKVFTSDLNGIRAVCRDFQQWIRGRKLPLEESRFEYRLRKEKVMALYWAARKSQLRHMIAVRVKAALKMLKSKLAG